MMNTSKLTVVCHPMGLSSNSTRAQHHMGAYFSIIHVFLCLEGFPHSSVGKESTCNAGYTGDMGLIPGLGIFPGGGNGNPLQYPCLENPMDRVALWATV